MRSSPSTNSPNWERWSAHGRSWLMPRALAGDSAVSPDAASLRGRRRVAQVPVTINFHFNLTPAAFLGEERLRAVQFHSRSGVITELPAQLAVTCIGYEAIACGEASPANGVFPNENGKVKERLYVVGWAKRGPSGTIPTNRSEAQQVAQKMAQEIGDSNRPGGSGPAPTTRTERSPLGGLRCLAPHRRSRTGARGRGALPGKIQRRSRHAGSCTRRWERNARPR